MNHEDVRRETFAEVSRAMNRVADIWERDGSDPCRVRITREYANAYRLYAEGLGEPTGSARRNCVSQEDIIYITAFFSPRTNQWHTEVMIKGIGPICSCGLGRNLRE
jgi:hypothetical protein